MIVGISGKARSGKDTFADMLAGEMNRTSYPPFVAMAFAHELKIKCMEAFDLSYEQLWGEEKEVPDKRYMKPTARVSGTLEPPPDAPGLYWTGREIMQEFGGFYRTIDNEFWIKNLFKTAEDKDYTNIIITDVRYINEADYILDKGGYVVRVERESKDDVHNMRHPSEMELDNYGRFDFTVMNNWGLEELREAAKDVKRFLLDSEKAFNKLKEIKIDG